MPHDVPSLAELEADIAWWSRRLATWEEERWLAAADARTWWGRLTGARRAVARLDAQIDEANRRLDALAAAHRLRSGDNSSSKD